MKNILKFVFCAFLIFLTFGYNIENKESIKKDNEIAVFIDNKKVTTGIPSKSSEYIFDKYICNDNKVIITWNNNDWNYNLGNIQNSMSCSLYFIEKVNIVYNFAYTGSSQEWIVPRTGKYKIELWGASVLINGNKLNSAYTSGEIQLVKDKKLYLYIGGSTNDMNGGFNGGGNGAVHPYDNRYSSSGGAGGTDIRTVNGNWNNSNSLSSRIMVVSGSAGVTYNSTFQATNEAFLINGSGGALSGISGNVEHGGIPGTQTSAGGVHPTYGCGGTPGTGGAFGIGGNGGINGEYAGNPGSGGGYYGGGGAQDICNGSFYGASGSSFISGHTGCVAINSETDQTPKSGCITGNNNNVCSIHYTGYRFTNTKMIDGLGYSWTNIKGTKEQMPNPSGGFYQIGTVYSGNGYARITYIGN